MSRQVRTYRSVGVDTEAFCSTCGSMHFAGGGPDDRRGDKARARAGRWAAEHVASTGHRVRLARELVVIYHEPLDKWGT